MEFLCRKRKMLRELGVVLSIFAMAGLLGWFHLKSPGLLLRIDAGPNGAMLLPGLCWALGHGYACPDPVPQAVQEFLCQHTERLDPRALDTATAFKPVRAGDKFFEDRRYLVATAGAFFRVFGPSWDAVRLFLSMVFGVSAVIMYGILRLGASRLLSVLFLIPSLLSPVLLEQLPWMRSFCKTPFVLGCLVLIGYVVSRRVGPKRLALLAAALGLTIGFGVGFRQDVIVCLPLALASVLVGARGAPRLSAGVRASAAILLLLGFAVPAGPHLKMTRNTGGNNSFYLTQGFAERSYRDLDLSPASYIPVASEGDYHVHSYIHQWQSTRPNYVLPYDAVYSLCMQLARAADFPFEAMRWLPFRRPCLGPDLDIWSFGAEMVARGVATDLFTAFPGDVVARTLACPLRVLRYMRGNVFRCADENSAVLKTMDQLAAPVARHFAVMGPVYALVCLFVLAGIDRWLAVWALLLVLWFCGYTSLEFQIRHVFHLNVLCFWAPAFLTHCLVRAVKSRPINWSRVKRATGAAALFMLAAVGVLGGVYAAAQNLQSRTVKPVAEVYYNAQLEPLHFTHAPTSDASGNRYEVNGLFRPAFDMSTPGGALAQLLFDAEEVQFEYLVAEMDVNAGDNRLLVNYRDPVENQRIDLGQLAVTSGRRVRMFIPVFNFLSRFREDNPFAVFSTFSGIEVDGGLVLKALYRVRNKKDFPLAMVVALPSDPTEFIGYHGLRLRRAAAGR